MKKLILAASLAALVPAAAIANEMMDNKANYFFKKIDMNGDGYISQSEHEDFSRKMFTEADSNRDGKVSQQELVDAKKKEKQEYSSDTSENNNIKDMKPSAR